MLVIEYSSINKIPIIEVYPKHNNKENLPSVVIYHGWTSHKGHLIFVASEIAKENFRVILPDCVYHGNRYQNETNLYQNPIVFYKTLMKTVYEFSEIESYIGRKRIHIGGFSMGAMISNMIFAKYPQVQSNFSLMGVLQQSKYNEWRQYRDYISVDNDDSNIFSQKQYLRGHENFFREVDISLKPECINGRPMLIWNALPDSVVPSTFNVEFYEQFKDHPALTHSIFQFPETGGHMVPDSVNQDIIKMLKHSEDHMES